jgi:Uri superfamily endonuclease
MDKGAYCLVMRLDDEKEITVGKKPPARFPEGFYCYVGSAMNGLSKRIGRHLSREKRAHWHIDWFLEHADIVDVKRIESKRKVECGLSKDVEALSDGSPMKGFGSSDCMCRSHLHHFREDPSGILNVLVERWKG